MRRAIVVLAAVLVALALAGGAAAQQQCRGVVPGSNPLLVRWPYLLSATERSLLVLFGTTRDVTEGSVVVSRQGGGGAVARFSATSKPIDAVGVNLNLFRAQVTGLEAGTTYCYNVFANVTVDGESQEVELAGALSFTTAPAANSTDTVRFVAIGDFGAGTPGQRRVRDAIFSRLDQSDMFIALGDDVYLTGTHVAYQRFNFEIYNEQWASLPLYLCAGNHDTYHDNAETYLVNFPQFMDQASVDPAVRGRYFSYDWAQVHFMSIDTEGELNKPADTPNGLIQWLERDLASTTKPWKVAFMHKTPYERDNLADSRIVEKLVPVFEKYGVQVVLGGHWHTYSRYPPLIGQRVVATTEGGVTYIVTGGGGFPVIGDIIPQGKGAHFGWTYDEKADSHNAHDDARGDAARVVGPVAAKNVQHFFYAVIEDCTFTLEAIDSDRVVFDRFVVNRCQ